MHLRILLISSITKSRSRRPNGERDWSVGHSSASSFHSKRKKLGEGKAFGFSWDVSEGGGRSLFVHAEIVHWFRGLLGAHAIRLLRCLLMRGSQRKVQARMAPKLQTLFARATKLLRSVNAVICTTYGTSCSLEFSVGTPAARVGQSPAWPPFKFKFLNFYAKWPNLETTCTWCSTTQTADPSKRGHHITNTAIPSLFCSRRNVPASNFPSRLFSLNSFFLIDRRCG